MCRSLSVILSPPSLSAHSVKTLPASPDLILMSGKAVSCYRVMETPGLDLSCGDALILDYPFLSQEDPTASLTLPIYPFKVQIISCLTCPLKLHMFFLQDVRLCSRPLSTSLAHPPVLNCSQPGSHETILSPPELTCTSAALLNTRTAKGPANSSGTCKVTITPPKQPPSDATPRIQEKIPAKSIELYDRAAQRPGHWTGRLKNPPKPFSAELQVAAPVPCPTVALYTSCPPRATTVSGSPRVEVPSPLTSPDL